MRTLAFAVIATAALALAGCKTTQTNDASMGSTSGNCATKEGCCKSKEGSMGAVSTEKKGCCKSKEGSMGAVSGSSCSEAKTSCSGK